MANPAEGGWGVGAWGVVPWGGTGITPPASPNTYFLPPVHRVHDRDMRAISITRFHLEGDTGDGDPAGYYSVGGVPYRNGTWNGPLRQEEIDAITAAGFGSRLFQATDLIQLPSDIEA